MDDTAQGNAKAEGAAREHEQATGHTTWVTTAGRRELWRCYRCRWTSDGPHNEPGPTTDTVERRAKAAEAHAATSGHVTVPSPGTFTEQWWTCREPSCGWTTYSFPDGSLNELGRTLPTWDGGLRLVVDADGSRDGAPGATLLMNGSHIIASITDINPGDARHVRLYDTQGDLLARWDRQQGPVAPPEAQETPPKSHLAAVTDALGPQRAAEAMATWNRATKTAAQEAADRFARGILINPETTYDADKARPGIDIIHDGRRVLTLHGDGTIEINTDEDTDHA